MINKSVVLNTHLQILIILGAILFTCSECQLIDTQPCPDLTPVQNFNSSMFVGKWYEIKKYYGIYEPTGRCVTDTLSYNSKGYFDIQHKHNEVLSIDVQDTAKLFFKKNKSEGRFNIKFKKWGVLPMAKKYNLVVLDTDYLNYATSFLCVDLVAVRIKFAWIHARTRMPKSTYLKLAKDALTRNGLSKLGMKKTDQKFCSD